MQNVYDTSGIVVKSDKRAEWIKHLSIFSVQLVGHQIVLRIFSFDKYYFLQKYILYFIWLVLQNRSIFMIKNNFYHIFYCFGRNLSKSYSRLSNVRVAASRLVIQRSKAAGSNTILKQFL